MPSDRDGRGRREQHWADWSTYRQIMKSERKEERRAAFRKDRNSREEQKLLNDSHPKSNGRGKVPCPLAEEQRRGAEEAPARGGPRD